MGNKPSAPETEPESSKKRAQRSDWLPIGALALLCSFWAIDTLRADVLPDLFPDPLPRFEGASISFVLFAAAAALLGMVSKAKWPRGRVLLDAIWIGAGMFVIPAVLIYLSDGRVSKLSQAALFSLVPVFALIFEPYIGADPTGPRRGGLLAALIALTGMLFAFPVQIPASIPTALGFCTVILGTAFAAAANCKAVVLITETAKQSRMPIIAIAAATVSAGFAGAGAVTEHAVWQWSLLGPHLLWSAAVELPGLFLLFWLMHRMSAVRMSTRYLIAPLISILLGVLLLHPIVQPRTWLGLLLVAAGAAYLLLTPEGQPENEVETSTLSLH
ncbi:DMT family transporter [Acidicapsa ligni]|uniref:DMT family transporter n=1 Tax=Acidicapsa ligni TaxID=542300 RepID=UPI0021DF5E4E|nr:DMT family transporter [Acidicapsa ligni]